MSTPPIRRRALLATGAVAAGTMIVTTQPSVAAEPRQTADDWEVLRGPATIIRTDRTYNGEPALRVDYDYSDVNVDGQVLLQRGVPAESRDWSDKSGMSFAVDGEQAPYAMQIQLQGRGGFIQSPLITLDTNGWNELYVPFHMFINIMGKTQFDLSEVTKERLLIKYHAADYDPHTVYVGAWRPETRKDRLLPDPDTVSIRTEWVQVGKDARAEFVIGRDDDYLYGLRGLYLGDTLSRNRELTNLIHPVAYHSDGTVREVFRFTSVARDGARATVHGETPDGRVSLRWDLEPASETIDGIEFRGIGYRYRISGDGRFDKIDEHATWELGGTSVDNVAVHRSSLWATEVDGATDAEFDTRYNHPPRFANMGAFEYQAGGLGQLLVTYDRAAAIQGQFAKQLGKDVFEYWDTYFVGRQRDVSTPTKLVLHAPEPVNIGVDLINAHTTVEDAVHSRFRRMYEIDEPQIVPSVTITGHPLDDYQRNDWLRLAADLGFKAIHIGPLWTSDPQNGGPSESRGFTLWSFDVDEQWGGNEALRRLTAAAGEHGLRIYMWAPAAHMSKNAPVVKDNPSWVAKGPYGAAASAYWSLAGIDLHDTEAQRYLLNGLVERHTQDGVDGVWLDSMHAHGFSQYDHENSVVKPQVEEMIGRVRELQDAGFTVYSEGRGPFAISGSAYNKDRINYYERHEHRAYATSMNFAVTPDHVDFYRFAANKALPYNSWGENGRSFWKKLLKYGDLRERVRHANHDYNAVAQYMRKRRLLPADHGVEWTSDDPDSNITVLFAYEAFDYRLPDAEAEITDVTTGESVPPDGETLRTVRRHTYLIRVPSSKTGREVRSP